MSLHSPSPWWLQRARSGFGDDRIYDNNGRLVGQVNTGPTGPGRDADNRRVEANKAVLVSAPTMFELMKSLIDHYYASTSDRNLNGFIHWATTEWLMDAAPLVAALDRGHVPHWAEEPHWKALHGWPVDDETLA